MFESLDTIAWNVLHQQKLALLELLERQADGSPEAEVLWATVNLLDALQDDAATAGRWTFPGEAGDATDPRVSPPLRGAKQRTPFQRTSSGAGMLRWRCHRCGTTQSTTDDPVELAQTGAPMCGECDDEMDPCETDLQPVLDALSRCVFVLFKISVGDTKAFGGAAEVAQASAKLLVQYGEQDEWMSKCCEREQPAQGVVSVKRYYVEDDEGHHHGPMDDYEEAASVADAIHGRIIVQEVTESSASAEDENPEGGA